MGKNKACATTLISGVPALYEAGKQCVNGILASIPDCMNYPGCTKSPKNDGVCTVLSDKRCKCGNTKLLSGENCIIIDGLTYT